MAAGDVTIEFDSGRGGGMRRQQRLIAGVLTLDGGNPSPIALASYFREVKGAVVSWRTSTAQAVDPTTVTCVVSGTTVNVSAWKVTGAGDTTLIASTNNANQVSFIAWGIP